MEHRDRRRVLGNALIAASLLALLSACGAWGWEQLQGQKLRDRLRTEPAAQVIASQPSAEATSPNAALPTQAPGDTAAATPNPSSTGAPALTLQALASPTLANTATPSPTPATGTKPMRMTIPDLHIDVPVSDMTWSVVNTSSGLQTDWVVPENAAGWAVNSAQLGEAGNLVLSGHNNIFGRVFMPISQAWPPSEFQKMDNYTDRSDILNGRKIEMIGADGRRFTYVITGFYRVKDLGVPLEQRQANAKWIDPTDHALLTLTTCWPPSSNTHRLIVTADLVETGE